MSVKKEKKKRKKKKLPVSQIPQKIKKQIIQNNFTDLTLYTLIDTAHEDIIM